MRWLVIELHRDDRVEVEASLNVKGDSCEGAAEGGG
jgi:hypothetical protein